MTTENGIETISIHEIPSGTPVFNSASHISIMKVEDLQAESVATQTKRKNSGLQPSLNAKRRLQKM